MKYLINAYQKHIIFAELAEEMPCIIVTAVLMRCDMQVSIVGIKYKRRITMR